MSSRPVATTSVPGKKDRLPKKEKLQRPHRVERKDLDTANRTAEYFLSLYYDRMDAPLREGAMMKLYRDDAILCWNGQTMRGVAEIKEFYTKLPKSNHTIQSWDCHPVPGVEPAPLMITISGAVTHGDPPAKQPSNKVVESLPRVFHQSFVLAPVPKAQNTEASANTQDDRATFAIASETMRFVG